MKTGRGTAVRSVVTTVLDLIGVVLLAFAAWCVWPPAAAAVLGAACLVSSWQQARPPKVAVADDEAL